MQVFRAAIDHMSVEGRDRAEGRRTGYPPGRAEIRGHRLESHGSARKVGGISGIATIFNDLDATAPAARGTGEA